uniref:CBS domain-containing protein n=1 Tax=Lactuca sativa TaxID=4236 RepID=A0A9R1VIF6_LACSA|nr:hypothetical protein LSAT_V11C500271810 [Lactuca sativa]
MQMDLRKVEEIVNDSKGGIIEKKEAIVSTLSNPNPNSDTDSDAGVSIPTTPSVDAASALQLFLDHIPISSIPGIHNSPSTVLVVRTQECVKDVIKMLYEKNVSGALVADGLEPDPTTTFTTSFSHPYVGFISFSNMVLWTLQIGELAASFMWDPVFPVKRDQTLFHVLLLLSKHRPSVVPVTQHSSSKVVGFVTENSVNHVLLQSSGLEWFDSIADKPLSDFRFDHNDQVVSIYNDQTIADAVHVLWKKKVCAVAVVKRQTEKLIGCVRVSDIHRLLADDRIFTDREDTSVEKFIHIDTGPALDDIDHDLGALISAGTLVLKDKFGPRMDSPVTNMEKDTLKEAMKNLAEKKSDFSFLVDECGRVKGVLTLRDMLVEFAPPCMDSRIDGGGFFDMALKESGCTIKDGTMVQLK